MAKFTPKQRAKMMRRMITPEEKSRGVRLYDSLAWRKRKWMIMQRVRRVEIRARYHSERRRGLRRDYSIPTENIKLQEQTNA